MRFVILDSTGEFRGYETSLKRFEVVLVLFVSVKEYSVLFDILWCWNLVVGDHEFCCLAIYCCPPWLSMLFWLQVVLLRFLKEKGSVGLDRLRHIFLNIQSFLLMEKRNMTHDQILSAYISKSGWSAIEPLVRASIYSW